MKVNLMKISYLSIFIILIFCSFSNLSDDSVEVALGVQADVDDNMCRRLDSKSSSARYASILDDVNNITGDTYTLKSCLIRCCA